ncbi:hypothetical protein [Mesomycoplasma ovipneumoniae]|uniref:hypothetical protein n=1 Tax=Mesomycoplasma ovipneumoniae TaxID=29562 RepID=UPI0030803D63
MKKITKSIFGMVSFSPIALIACGGPVNEFAHNKEIIVALTQPRQIIENKILKNLTKLIQQQKTALKLELFPKMSFQH